MLKKASAALLVQTLINIYLNVNGTGSSNVQSSSKFYRDLTFSVLNNKFQIIKTLSSFEFNAQLLCGRSCGFNEQCQAFNIYKIDTAYICEMLPIKMGVNQTQIAYVPRSGAIAWEKLTLNVPKPFLEKKLMSVAPVNYCEAIRPGCSGTWPNCDNCVKSCIDCQLRYNYTGMFTCTVWPGPTPEENTPITTTCYDKLTHLLRRVVNLTNGQILEHHIMPFRDMNRLIRLNAYSVMQFSFNHDLVWYQALYNNPYIAENGTLMNLTFRSSNSAQGDGLKLGTSTLAPAPFITVDDDKFKCGSFWLLDSNNATYCPGGGVGLFGTPTLDNSGKVNDSGIHWPLAKIQGNIPYCADIGLWI